MPLVALLAAAWTVASSLLTDVALGLLCVGAGLGVVAFGMWWRNRHALRALNDFLHEQAQQGLAALEQRHGV